MAYIDLPISSSAPSGAAGGDLSGTYPNPVVATVGGVSAAALATSQALTLASTSAATASTLVKRDANGNFQTAALTMTHVSAGIDNAGMGGPASASAAFPFLIQRDYVGVIVTQTANPNTGAGTGAKDQLSADNGNNIGEIGLFSAATSAPDAYAGGAMTLRCSGSAAGISIIADDSATFVKTFVGGNANANMALQSKTDLTTISYGGIIISTAGARPTAGASYRGMLFVVQGADGVSDELQVCLKSDADDYSWKTIAFG